MLCGRSGKAEQHAHTYGLRFIKRKVYVHAYAHSKKTGRIHSETETDAQVVRSGRIFSPVSVFSSLSTLYTPCELRKRQNNRSWRHPLLCSPFVGTVEMLDFVLPKAGTYKPLSWAAVLPNESLRRVVCS